MHTSTPPCIIKPLKLAPSPRYSVKSGVVQNISFLLTTCIQVYINTGDVDVIIIICVLLVLTGLLYHQSRVNFFYKRKSAIFLFQKLSETIVPIDLLHMESMLYLK